MTKFSRALAVAGISGALAVGGAGVAQASSGGGHRSSPDRPAKVEKRYDRSRLDGKSRAGSRHDSKGSPDRKDSRR